MVLDLLILRQAVVLLGTGAAAYTDAKTGLILDRITYAMIAAGILLNIFQGEWMFLATGIIVFCLGYLLYYMGKIGGGDVKLFAGIAFVLPFFGGNFFLLNALFAACVLAVVFYSAFFLVKYARMGIDWKLNTKSILRAGIFGLAIAAWLFAIAIMGIASIQGTIILAIPLGFALVFLAFEPGIRKSFFLKKISLKKLEEDEVVAVDFLDKKTKKALGLIAKGVLGKKEIQKLQKAGIKSILVYRNMPPFGPFIFLGCIAAMAMPGLVSAIFIA